ncbi:MAG: hypothetical protein R3Y05_00390 [bacterium]
MSLTEINIETIISSDLTKLPQNIVFNQKGFVDKKTLSYEMATYWELAIRSIKKNVYKYMGMEPNDILDIDELKNNKQYDIALIKVLNYLNPTIIDELKRIVEKDNNQTTDSLLETKGKLKYHGGDNISPLIHKNDSTYVQNMPQEGDKIQTSRGSILILGDKIGDGGEGIVYTTNRKNEVVKLIKRDNKGCIRNYTKDRIEQMVKVKITNPLVIWPTDVVYNEDGLFVGFTMKHINGIDLKRFTSSIVRNVNDNPDEFNINSLDKKSLCKIAISILDTMIYLHDMNIIMGDIKLENFMIKDNNIENIYFIDCDSYQVGHFPSILVSPGFVPPEIDPINLGKQNNKFRTFGNENFCLFSLLFHLVFRAKPPYSQQIHDERYVSETYRVKHGMFPYFLDKEKTVEHCPKGMEEPIWAHLPSYMKKAFISVGHIDGENFAVENRLSATDWKHLFTCYLEDLEGVRLPIADPICNQYHYGLNEFINYENVDLPLPTEADVLHNLSMDEQVIRRARNNDYMKNMLLYRCVSSNDFPLRKFEGKLYTSRILFSLALIKNWSKGLEFIQEDLLGSFALTPTEFTKVNNNKILKKYELALFEFVRIINPNIFLAYDGLNFNKLDEYARYLNDHYNLDDRIIIPFDILSSVIEDAATLRTLQNIFAKSVIVSHDIDLMINLFSDRIIYTNGTAHTTIHSYISSIFKDELKVLEKNLFLYKSISDKILTRSNIDTSLYDFTSLKGFYQLAMTILNHIPFKSGEHTFKNLNDIVEYSKLDIPVNEKYTNIGKWVKTGLIKIYSSYYQLKSTDVVVDDLYKVSKQRNLTDWEAGQLFYLKNVQNPFFYTMDGIKITNLRDLMEKMLKSEQLDGYVHELYKNVLFTDWCEIYKKKTD